MGRRNRKKPLGHKPKGGQRPRSWHHGRGAGRVQLAKLDQVTPAFVAAEADAVAVQARSRAHRASQADWEAQLAQLERAAPAARAPWPDPPLWARDRPRRGRLDAVRAGGVRLPWRASR